MQKKLLRGFTLIELIITITILSILAVALLAALDPIEQFNRARDTGTRNTMLELHQAIQRNYAVRQAFDSTVCGLVGGGQVNQSDGTCTVTLSGNNPTTGLIQALAASGELKTNFDATASKEYVKIRIYLPANSSDLKTCFTPTSKGFQRDVNTIYNTTDGNRANQGTCLAENGSTTCAYCVQ